MKKIAGKIAMILILVMLANSFAGCTLLGGVFLPDTTGGRVLWVLGMVTDLIVIILLVVGAVYAENNRTSSDDFIDTEKTIYLVNAEYNNLFDYNTFYERLNSLPETERNSFMKKLNSLPEEKRSSLINIIAALPETEIASSSERVKALSDKEFASAVQKFSMLSEAELDLVIDKLHKRATYHSNIYDVATVDYDPVYAYASLRLQY